jgi:thiamine biosynthesis protein ThiI
MDCSFLCHYHEIALKGGNRRFFETILRDNIRKSLRGLEHGGVQRRFGRLQVLLKAGSPVAEIESRLSRVFGISNYSRAWAGPDDLDSVGTRLLAQISGKIFKTFKIHARRADKRFPLKSPEINRILGARVAVETGMKVQLENPELTCYVHFLDGQAHLYFERIRGAGGLPVSSGGKAVALLSGGIDSPVAAYRIMRRGCRTVFVHFHSYPHTSLEAQEKVIDLARILTVYQYRTRLYLVPFAEIQRQIVALTPPASRVLLYRRFMVRIADRIARREKAQALVTGESIGQVASQTLENIRAIGAVARFPVLRPLIGFDKEEIINQARQIGTFETSTQSDEDCCSLFVPRHPETRARIDQLQAAEEPLDIPTLVRQALAQTRLEILEAG